MAIEDVVRDYGASWGETDTAARQKLLDDAWAETGVYCDPTGQADGRAALVEHIGGFQEQFPGHRIDLTSGVEEHHGWFRFGWSMKAPDGTSVIDGFDVGQLADDGRIQRIVGFFGPFPEA